MTIMIGTPAYNGQVTTQYLQSLMRLKDAGFIFDVPDYADSLITRARNSLVSIFLSDAKYTHLVWIDSDIGFTVEQFARLVNKNVPIAAAPYPFKNLLWKGTPVSQEEELLHYVVNLKQENTTIPEDKWIEVLDAATGFMCIRRDALEQMVRAYPKLKYTNDVPGGPTENMYLLFDTMVEGDRYLSEDYAFCRRWQKIGGTIWLDIDSKLTHTGPHTFNGDFLLTNNLALKNQGSQEPVGEDLLLALGDPI